MLHNWSFLNSPPSSGPWNMAVDQFLMEGSGNWLRFYQWEIPTLSLGYFQKIKEVDQSPLAEGKTALVRRLTGGKAVLHHRELTYSISADCHEFPGSLNHSYKKIGTALVKGLQHLGIQAELIERTPEKLEEGNCFKVPGWFEVVYKGKKLIGSAQTRRKSRLLQHGSLLLDCDRALLGSFFPDSTDPDSSLITLMDILGEIPPIEKIKEALLLGFSEQWNQDFKNETLEDSQKEKIEQIKSRYLDNKWTYSR